MWESIQYSLILCTLMCALTFNSGSLPQFALYSELVWLALYLLVCISGSLIDSPELLSTPFLILVLTAVEAVIVWILVVYSFKFIKI